MRISLQAGVQSVALHDADAAGDAVAITPGESAGGDCSPLLGKGKDSGDPGRLCAGEVRGPMIEVADGACFNAVSANAGFRDVQIHLHDALLAQEVRSEEHTSELQSLMRISYAVF